MSSVLDSVVRTSSRTECDSSTSEVTPECEILMAMMVSSTTIHKLLGMLCHCLVAPADHTPQFDPVSDIRAPPERCEHDQIKFRSMWRIVYRDGQSWALLLQHLLSTG